MKTDELYKTVQLTTNKYADDGLHKGMIGTILEKHNDDTYEIEWYNDKGEVVNFFAFNKCDFVIINKNTSMNIKDKEQSKYLSDLENALKSKYREIYKFFYIPCFGKSASLYIFFKTNTELIKYEYLKNEIKNYIYSYLNSNGYFKKFNDKITIEFDSDENVNKNYEGNYYYRLL